LSCLVLSCLILSYIVLSCLVLSRLVSSRFVVQCRVVSCVSSHLCIYIDSVFRMHILNDLLLPPKCVCDSLVAGGHKVPKWRLKVTAGSSGLVVAFERAEFASNWRQIIHRAALHCAKSVVILGQQSEEYPADHTMTPPPPPPRVSGDSDDSISGIVEGIDTLGEDFFVDRSGGGRNSSSNTTMDLSVSVSHNSLQV
jgi:hypothetical protein